MEMLMSSTALAGTQPTLGATALRPAAISRPAALRSLLLSGCIASVAMAAWLGEPAALMRSDAELAQLLRGMAAIKGLIVLAAVGALLWRFGQPAPRRIAIAYLLGAWLIAGATMLVWQLSLVPLAALAFHAGEFTLLIAAWRDREGGLPRPTARA
jgi:hypothetical protein